MHVRCMTERSKRMRRASRSRVFFFIPNKRSEETGIYVLVEARREIRENKVRFFIYTAHGLSSE